MAFIVYGFDGRYFLQTDQTGAYIGTMIRDYEGESGRAFSYDFGTIYEPKEVVNFQEFPELAKMPFFAIDYSTSSQDVIQKLNPQKQRQLYTLLTSECKFGACHHHQKTGEKLSLLWQYTPPNHKGYWKLPIWSLTVNQESCWIGNREGLLLGLNHQGEIINQQELGSKIQTFCTNADKFYCACDDGKIYDLNNKVPQIVYDNRSRCYDYGLNIFNFTFVDDYIVIVDTFGNLKLLNNQGQRLWENNHDRLWRSWFLAYQNPHIYVGHSRGINCYEVTKGKLMWKNPMKSAVLWGEILDKYLIIGTSDGQIYKVNQEGDWKTQKSTRRKIFQGKSALFTGTIIPQRKMIICADYQGYIYALNYQGQLFWQKSIETGAVLNLKAWENSVFAVTTEGSIFAFNLNQT